MLDIGIDLDNTCAQTARAVRRELQKRFGVEPQECYDLLPADQPEAREWLLRLFESPQFYLGLLPVPRAREGIEMLAELGDLYYISSRPASMVEVSIQWLDRHNFAPGEVFCQQEKVERARQLGISLFVEDSPEVALTLAEAGIHVLLLRYPYNQGCQHPQIRSVEGWGEIIEILEVGL